MPDHIDHEQAEIDAIFGAQAEAVDDEMGADACLHEHILRHMTERRAAQEAAIAEQRALQVRQVEALERIATVLERLYAAYTAC